MSQQTTQISYSEDEQTDNQPTIQTDFSADNIDAYRCPKCDEEWSSELFTRVHMTRSDDAEHDTVNGLMPDTAIEALKDGELVDRILRHPDDIELADLTVEDMPSELSNRDKHILLVATQNPYVQSYTELEEKVEKQLAENGIKMPSYETIRRVINNFYHPQTDREVTKISNLTPLQQDIVIARVAKPDESQSGIARIVGCAASYPAQVLDKTQPIVDELSEAADEGEQVDNILLEMLPEGDINRLQHSKLASEISLNFDVDDTVADTSTEEQQSSETTEENGWGDPVTKPTILSAQPEYPVPDTSRVETDTETETENLTSTTPLEATECNSETDAPVEEMKKEIEDLKKKVTFISNIMEQAEAHTDGESHAFMIAFANEVEDACERAISG